MKINYKITFVFIALLNAFWGLAQHNEKYNKLTHLKITKDVCTALDSIISHEKECEYYNDNLIFAVDIKKAENGYYVNIESVGDSNIIQGLNPYGYFYYGKHLVVVNGDKCEGLFSITKEKRRFNYIEYDPTYQEERAPQKIYYFNDDSYSRWYYVYIDKKLVLKEKFSSCN